MSILTRFKDIMASNINALLDKAEDPEKMIDQYLRNLQSDLGKVKAETASVMAEEKRAKRELSECVAESEKLQKYAVKAVQAGNDADARKFLEKKNEVAAKQAGLEQAVALAENNANQMKAMHDKLLGDISELESRKNMLKAKWSVAKTQERLNKMTSVTSANGTLSAFDRMEEKINKKLDEANAMAELNAGPDDGVEDLMSKYDSGSAGSSSQVDDELAALKAAINQNE